MKKFLLSTAAAVLFAGAASAADMPARQYTKAPPMAPMFNWSGVYIGIHGGYGWADSNGFGSDLDGGFVGGQIGINWQAPGSNWVFGLELDSAWANIEQSATGTIGGLPATATAEIDYLGSFRGRIGYAWGPTMVYATGGIGWANTDLRGSVGGVNFVGGDNSNFGFTVGGGVEHAINAGPWSVKLEYLYYGLDDNNFTVGGVAVNSGDTDIHTVKLGLNYRFGAGWGRW